MRSIEQHKPVSIVLDKALGPRWGRTELVRGDSLELCQLTCSEGEGTSETLCGKLRFAQRQRKETISAVRTPPIASGRPRPGSEEAFSL